MHAIERIYGFAAQDSGYYYADVINTDDARSDLINYQYMLYGLCNEMMKMVIIHIIMRWLNMLFHNTRDKS